MAGRFSIDAVFRAIDRVSAPVTRMQNRVRSFTRSFRHGLTRVNRAADRLGGALRKVGTYGAIGLLALGAAMAHVVLTGADFEQSLVNAAAKFPGKVREGTKAFQKLEAVARHVGATTQFTASQAAQGLNYLAMAGFNAEQSVAALPGVVDLATASETDLATASDIATDTLGAFGLNTKNAIKLAKNLGRVNDVLAKTVTTSNTNMTDLFETIKDGGPVAKGAGADIETFSALAGQLANAGIKGSKAGTTLKNMFLRLAAPAAKGAKTLKYLGVKTMDARGNLRDVVDVLGDLNKAISKKVWGAHKKRPC